MSAPVYVHGEREGMVLSFSAVARATMALEHEEWRLMGDIERFGPHPARNQLLSRTRLALAELGRTPAEAWADRCRFLEHAAVAS